MDDQMILVLVGIVCVLGLAGVISLIVILPIIGTFGGIGLWFKNRSDKAKAVKAAAQNWARTRGTILKSRVQVSGGEIASVYPYIEYRYQVGAVEYSSNQIRPGDRLVSTYGEKESYDVVDQYPVGAEVNVYYDPNDPAQASLER